MWAPESLLLCKPCIVVEALDALRGRNLGQQRDVASGDQDVEEVLPLIAESQRITHARLDRQLDEVKLALLEQPHNQRFLQFALCCRDAVICLVERQCGNLASDLSPPSGEALEPVGRQNPDFSCLRAEPRETSRGMVLVRVIDSIKGSLEVRAALFISPGTVEAVVNQQVKNFVQSGVEAQRAVSRGDRHERLRSRRRASPSSWARAGKLRPKSAQPTKPRARL